AGYMYSLRIPYMATAYSLFLNKTPVSRNGTVGRDRQSSTPGYMPRVVEFTAAEGENELVLQVSNFHHRRGGPFQIIYLGQVKAIARMDSEKVFVDWAFVVIYLTMGLYQCAFFLLRKDKSILFLALFFVFAGLEGLIETPEVLIFRVFPSFSWVLYEKLCYVISYAIPIWLLLFGYDLFGGMSRRILTVSIVPLLAILLFVLCTPPYVFSIMNGPFQIYSIFIFGLVLGMIVLAARRKHPGAKVIGAGYLMFTGTLLSSIFFANNRILEATNLPLSFLAYYKVNLFQSFSIPVASFSYLFILISINIMSLSYFYKHPEVMKKHLDMDASVASIDVEGKSRPYGLSARETEIVRLILGGKTNSEIADILFISLSTVKTHISHIFQKTGAKTREELFFLLQDVSRD
ncbi:MAG TPA: LuxR C-terminal-related transcriptional regulator, partial [Rectinemataceae bacterium]|nr:LuxR C-terminal-related transcriptional regulator [Rectinemataceae bacterium]